MGSGRTNADQVKQQAQARAAQGVPQRVYQGQQIKAGTFLNPSMDVRYGGRRVSRLPKDLVGKKKLLPISIIFDVSGSNLVVAAKTHNDLPQFWGLTEYLLPPELYHLNLQFGAITDWLHEEESVQLSQFESNGALVDRWLTDLYPVGGGYSNGVEGYDFAMWLLGHMNDIELWQTGEKAVAFILFDEGFESSLDVRHMHEIFNGATAPIDDKTEGLSVNMRQLSTSTMQLPALGSKITTQEIVADLKKKYHLFGVHCSESDNYGYDFSEQKFVEWSALLGAESVFRLTDSANISELVAGVTARALGVGRNKILNAVSAGNTLIGSGLSEITNALDLVSPSGSSSIVPNNKIKRL